MGCCVASGNGDRQLILARPKPANSPPRSTLDRTLFSSGVQVAWTGMAREPTPARAAHSSSDRKLAPAKPPPRIKALDIVPAAAPPPITTKAFWPLMDRWAIPDDKALQLLGKRRSLTAPVAGRASFSTRMR